jgi:hypothetical protein
MKAVKQEDLIDKVKNVEAIAKGVVHVSEAIKELQAGRLNDKAILVLLAHSTGLSQKHIKAVIDGLGTLSDLYIKQDT